MKATLAIFAIIVAAGLLLSACSMNKNAEIDANVDVPNDDTTPQDGTDAEDLDIDASPESDPDVGELDEFDVSDELPQ